MKNSAQRCGSTIYKNVDTCLYKIGTKQGRLMKDGLADGHEKI